MNKAGTQFIEELRSKLNDLREKLLNVLSEWHYLKYIIEPKIQFDYECIFGELETKIHEKNLNACELEKRIELLNKRAERSGMINESTIDFVNKMVGSEYMRYIRYGVVRAWDKDGNPVFLARPRTFTYKASNGYHIPGFTGSKPVFKYKKLSFDRSKEEQIPVMYRKIVKKLHPDAVGSETEHFKKHWIEIQESYKHMDFDRLSLFYKVFCYDDENIFEDPKTEENALMNEIRDTKICIRKEKEKIKDFKASEPYTYKNFLNDKLWIARRKRKMHDKLFNIDRRIIQNRKLLRQMTGGISMQLTTEVFSAQLRESLSVA